MLNRLPLPQKQLLFVFERYFLLDKLAFFLAIGVLVDQIIQVASYELVEQKISLKNEKELLLRKWMSGWIEPTRDYIKTLCQAEKIASAESLGEISQFAQKIGTNRLISEKIASWDFAPPLDFTAQFLASPASRRDEQTIALASRKSRSPIWCAWMDSNHRPRLYKSRALTN